MTPNVSSLEEQKLSLSAKLALPMAYLARQCAQVWPDKTALDSALQ